MKRYEPYLNMDESGDYCDMVEVEDGDWVEYDDHRREIDAAYLRGRQEAKAEAGNAQRMLNAINAELRDIVPSQAPTALERVRALREDFKATLDSIVVGYDTVCEMNADDDGEWVRWVDVEMSEEDQRALRLGREVLAMDAELRGFNIDPGDDYYEVCEALYAMANLGSKMDRRRAVKIMALAQRIREAE